MPILITTVSLLFLFGIFNYSQFQQHKEVVVIDKIRSKYVEEEQIDLTNKITKSAHAKFNNFAKSNPNPTRKKLTRFLHIRPLFEDSADLNDPRYKTTKHLLINLIKSLFSNTSFFQEAKISAEDFVDLILKQAKPLIKSKRIKKDEDLGKINLENPICQSVFFKMLKGTKPLKRKSNTTPSYASIDDTHYESLLDFISLTPRAIPMSAYLAPGELLSALLSKPDAVDTIIFARDIIYKDISKEDKPIFEDFDNRFKKLFDNNIPNEIDKNYIDFTVSTSDPNKFDDVEEFDDD